MRFTEKFDNFITGFISGLLLPVLVAFIVYLFSPGNLSIQPYIARILETHIITHSISICVFSNIIIFLIFNRFDMLKASQGVLAITIIWAVIVFALKIFG
jgi:hypothetical protein